MKISLICPSRERPELSFANVQHWYGMRSRSIDVEIIVSLDNDDPKLGRYLELYRGTVAKLIFERNKSSVEAINRGAEVASGDIIMVVSDDTKCINNWDEAILKEVESKTDWILKTQDGIQPWIITMPVMDRAYYNRTGYIYHLDFDHMFCDTYMSCVADINGRRITSPLVVPHKNDSIKDELRKRTDATWNQGEETFIRLMKQFSPEERSRIADVSMKNWLRNKGVR